MGRFTPGIQRKGGLAQALVQGVEGYQGQVDRQRGEEDRQLRRSIDQGVESDRARQSELDALAAGWMPQGQPTLADSLMGSPVPGRPPNAPGDFNRDTKAFQTPPISPMDAIPMRSGGSFNPQLPMQRKVAEEQTLGRAKIGIGVEERDQYGREFGGAVQAAGGPPAAARDLPTIREYLAPQDADWAYVGANTGEPAFWVNRKTQERRAVEGSRPLPRGTDGGDGLTVSERNKVTQIEDLMALIQRAQGAQVGPDGKLVKSGRIGGVVPIPNWARLQFDVGGRPSRQLQLLVSDMTSQVGNLRSGGAITPQEFERLEGFLPTMNERPEVIADKLQSFYDTLEDMMSRRRARMKGASPAQADRLDGAPEKMRARIEDFLPPED